MVSLGAPAPAMLIVLPRLVSCVRACVKCPSFYFSLLRVPLRLNKSWVSEIIVDLKWAGTYVAVPKKGIGFFKGIGLLNTLCFYRFLCIFTHFLMFLYVFCRWPLFMYLFLARPHICDVWNSASFNSFRL